MADTQHYIDSKLAEMMLQLTTGVEESFKLLNEKNNEAFRKKKEDISTPPTHNHELELPKIEKFNGANQPVEHFLADLKVLFAAKPRSFDSDYPKMAYAIMVLTGQAKTWLLGEAAKESAITQSYTLFEQKISRAFGDPTRKLQAKTNLHKIRQGPRTVGEYNADFRQALYDSDYNEAALIDYYIKGLNNNFARFVTTLARLPDGLQDLMELVMANEAVVATVMGSRSDQYRPTRQYPERTPVRGSYNNPPPANQSNDPNAMQLDNLEMKTDPRNAHCLKNRLCFRCLKSGHAARFCTAPRVEFAAAELQPKNVWG